MKTFQIAGAALIAASTMTGAVFAADMGPPRVHAVPVLPPPCAWCGVYVGVNAGADWGRSDVKFYPNQLWAQDPNATFFQGVGSPNLSRTNFSGGAQIGVNSQWYGWMVGLEVDVEYIGLHQSRAPSVFTGPVAGPLGGVAESLAFSENVRDNWVSTQRLRFGYATSAALFYATGGVAVSQQQFSQSFGGSNFNGGVLPPGFLAPVISTGTVTRWVGGWTAGGGAEFKLGQAWSVRAEYLYIDLGRTDFTSTLAGVAAAGAGPLGTGFTAHSENHMWTHVARIGLNYQFGYYPTPVGYYK